MKRLKLTDYLALALATAAVATASLYAKALQADGEPGGNAEGRTEGRIVEIQPGDLSDLPVVEGTVPEGAEETTAQGPARLWVGIAGRPVASPVLRTHLQLADDLGVVVEQVVSGSPAEKAGLRRHDVLIGVNGEPVTDLGVVQKAVVSGQGESIELKVIRLAQETVIEVEPEPMPADLARQRSLEAQSDDLFGPGRIDRELFDRLRMGIAPELLRRMDPGALLDGEQMNRGGLPSDVSVSISREGDGPAKVTVKRGDQSWTVEADDEQALNELPKDLRPMVRRLLRNGGEGQMVEEFDLRGQLENLLPNNLGQFEMGDLDERMQEQGAAATRQARRAARLLRQQAEQLREKAGAASEQLMDRIEQLEERLEQLQQQLDNQASQQPAGD